MDEITTKWKHLRDHFYREIKLQEAGEAHKKRKYVYFDDMEFMRPFVGYKLTANKNNSIEDANDYVDNDTEIDMDAFLKSTDNIEAGTATETAAESPDTKSDLHTSLQLGAGGRPRRVVKPTPKALQNKPSTSSSSNTTSVTTRSQKEAVIKNFNVLKKSGTSNATANSANPSFKIRDGDISFCLSLVPTLRKLGDGRKLRAKIDILKVLHRYVDHIERRNAISMQHANNSTGQIIENDDDMAEDHLEEYEEAVNVKHEEHDDPLNGGAGGGAGSASGNTKAWWT